MAITRADIAGALKVLNANSLKDRRTHLANMLKAEHPQRIVDKALLDLESYPEWHARTDLDVVNPVKAVKAVKAKTSTPAAP